MTTLHERALVMAREIAADVVGSQTIRDGNCDNHPAVKSALAAILRTTELAATYLWGERINALEQEVERLRKMLVPDWFYLGDDCSSDQCRYSVNECVDEDFLWDNPSEGEHVLEISTAMRGPTIWACVKFFTDVEKDERQDDEDYQIIECASEEEARSHLALKETDNA